jgi:hypothetical protein
MSHGNKWFPFKEVYNSIRDAKEYIQRQLVDGSNVYYRIVKNVEPQVILEFEPEEK